MEEEILQQLLSRSSVKQVQQPAPTDEEIYHILSCAARAPDHKELQPWRLIYFKGEIGAALADKLAQQPLAQLPENLSRVKKFSGQLTEPLVILVVAKLVEHEVIPQYEQILTIGGAAMNILNACHFLGYGAFWSSTLHPIDKLMPSILGLVDNEQLFGIMAVGSPMGDNEVKQRLDPAQFSQQIT